jgi:hypothetical protein
MINRYILFIALITASLDGMAQSWQVGVKGTFNFNWLLNNNLACEKMMGQTSFGYSEGASIGFNLHEDNYYNRACFGFYLEYYYQSVNQNYAYCNPADTLNLNCFSSATHISMSSIPLLFRAKTESGLYCEMGPQLNLIQSVTSDYHSDNNPELNYSNRNSVSTYNKTTFSFVFGAGIESKLVGNDWLIETGVRGSYGMQDIKLNQGVELNKSKTTLATAGALIGLVYKINYYHIKRRGH